MFRLPCFASLELGGRRERTCRVNYKKDDLVELGAAGIEYLHWHVSAVSVHRLTRIGVAHAMRRPLT